VIPAYSNCARCFRVGELSTNQNRRGGAQDEFIDGLRFHCVCGHIWITQREHAESMARFITKAGLHPKPQPLPESL
jgi:hypothetical protein